MGAWGLMPFENDAAAEWISNYIEKPILKASREKIEQFLADPEDNWLKHEVEAAIALLIDLTDEPGCLKYCQFGIAYLAWESRVWEIAIKAIKKLMADENWLETWNHPEGKQQILKDLLSELQLRMTIQFEEKDDGDNR